MSKCGLSVEIDEGDRQFKLGEKVAGQVAVHAEADCRCNGLKAALIWKAHGHTSECEGLRSEHVLYEGEWQATESHRYPFKFEIPNGPLTYHGEHFSVDWAVVAEADIASALDARAERTFTVTLGDDPARVTLPRARSPIQSARLAVAKAILKVIGGLVIGAPGWIMLISGILGVAAGQHAGWMGVVVGAVFAAAGTSLLINGVRWLLGASLLKVSHFALDPSVCRAGGEFVVNLVFTPRRSITIDGITATLEGEEKHTYSGAKSNTVCERKLAGDVRALDGPPSASPGLPVSVSGRLTVPKDAPNSFRISKADRYFGLKWTVQVKVGIRGRPDWTRDLVLIVGP
jgi:hypothetical protein